MIARFSGWTSFASLRSIALSGAALLAVAAGVPGVQCAFAEDDAPTVADWIAVELGGKPVEGPTLSYSSDKVSGTGGCNRFMGPISIEDDAVQIGPLAGTRMMCDGKMEVETAYLAALEAARTFSIENGLLVLKGEDGGVLAKFKK